MFQIQGSGTKLEMTNVTPECVGSPAPIVSVPFDGTTSRFCQFAERLQVAGNTDNTNDTTGIGVTPSVGKHLISPAPRKSANNHCRG